MMMLSPVNSNVPCMISRLIFLFICCFMFLINNNDSEVFKWSKNSRSCTNNDLYFFSMNTSPFIIFFPCRQCTMKHRHIRTKSAGEKYRSEEHTSELQSRFDLVCRLLLEKKKIQITSHRQTTINNT